MAGQQANKHGLLVRLLGQKRPLPKVPKDPQRQHPHLNLPHLSNPKQSQSQLATHLIIPRQANQQSILQWEVQVRMLGLGGRGRE